MGAQKTLTQHPAAWSEAAAALLAPVVADDETGGLDNLRAQLDAGAALVEVRDAGRLVGAYVMRIDAPAAGRELVVIAAAGRCAGVSLLDAILPVIEVQAAAAGCAWVRIHTSRPGLMRRLSGGRPGVRSLGYRFSEAVFRKEVTRVRRSS